MLPSFIFAKLKRGQKSVVARNRISGSLYQLIKESICSTANYSSLFRSVVHLEVIFSTGHSRITTARIFLMKTLCIAN